MEALKPPQQDEYRLRHIFHEKSVSTLCDIHHKDLAVPNTKSIIVTDLKSISYIDGYGRRSGSVRILFAGDKNLPWLTLDARRGAFVSPQPLCLDCYGMFLLAST